MVFILFDLVHTNYVQQQSKQKLKNSSVLRHDRKRYVCNARCVDQMGRTNTFIRCNMHLRRNCVICSDRLICYFFHKYVICLRCSFMQTNYIST